MESIGIDILILIFDNVDAKTWFRCLQLNKFINKALSIDKMNGKWAWKYISRQDEYPKSYKELSERMKKKQLLYENNFFKLKEIENPPIYNEFVTSRYYFDIKTLSFISKINNSIYCIKKELILINPKLKLNNIFAKIGLRTGIILQSKNDFYIVYEPDLNYKIRMINKWTKEELDTINQEEFKFFEDSENGSPFFYFERTIGNGGRRSDQAKIEFHFFGKENAEIDYIKTKYTKNYRIQSGDSSYIGMKPIKEDIENNLVKSYISYPSYYIIYEQFQIKYCSQGKQIIFNNHWCTSLTKNWIFYTRKTGAFNSHLMGINHNSGNVIKIETDFKYEFNFEKKGKYFIINGKYYILSPNY
jgi:hypothetical protein